MGIERARVVEVHSPRSATRRVGSGYLVSDRLVLTAGDIVDRDGPTHIRPTGRVAWSAASWVWAAPSGDAAMVELEDPSAVMLGAGTMRWGRVGGRRPLPVAAMGFPPVPERPDRWRDAGQFFGRLMLDGPDATSLPVEATIPGDGPHGAALFAGAELVGVLDAGPARLRAVPVSAFAEDPWFVELVGRAGRLDLMPVSAPATGFPIL